MKFALTYLIILTIQLLFLFDKNEGWFNQLIADLERFLLIKDSSFEYLLLIFLSSFFLTSIIFISEKIFNIKNYFGFFLSSIFAHLLIFYFLRIYISRLSLIIILVLIPLILLLIQKYSIIYTASSMILIISIGLFLNLNYIQTNVTENYSKISESNCQDNIYFIKSNCNLEEKEIQYGEKFKIENYLNFENNFLQTFNLNNKFIFDKYSLCCEIYNSSNIAGKPTGYIDIYKDIIFFINSSGFIFYVNEEAINKDNFQFIQLNNNLSEVTNNKLIFESEFVNFGWEGVKDILIVDDNLFVSIIDEKEDNCTNIQVLMGKINFEFIEFSKVFSPKECIKRNQYGYSTYGSGGKMSAYKLNEILISTGDVFLFDRAQNPNSTLGKVIKINYLTLDYEIISIGHRNPQGLYYSEANNKIVETEHGPQGGDEINLININKIENFGWPISSYGEHYNGEVIDEAPLFKSHLNYGFKEPIYYFEYELVGSHGISAVEQYIDNNFIVGTLNARAFYDVSIDFQLEKITNIQTYFINERIRDIKVSINSNKIYLILEDTPSLGVLLPIKITDN